MHITGVGLSHSNRCRASAGLASDHFIGAVRREVDRASLIIDVRSVRVHHSVGSFARIKQSWLIGLGAYTLLDRDLLLADLRVVSSPTTQGLSVDIQ